MTNARRRKLLLAIHDVGPRFEAEVERLRDHLGRHADPGKIALLVVPNHWGEAPITPGSAFATRLRGWAQEGAEIFVHGWFHKDTQVHRARIARVKAQYMTAGEGEFLGLNRTAARAVMHRGKVLLEDIIGRRVAGFVAPAWLYGPGAIDALADCDFALAEDHWKVWQPGTGEVVSRSPVLTWASRSPGRIASSLLAARALPPMLCAARVMRVGVHPGDTGVPELMTSIDRTVAGLVRSRVVARYADLIPTTEPACAS